VLFLTPTSPLPTASDRLHSDETAPQQSATQHKCKKRRHNNEKAVAAESRLVHLFVSLFRKKKEARESGLCDGLKKLIAFFGLSSTLVVVEYLAASLAMILMALLMSLVNVSSYSRLHTAEWLITLTQSVRPWKIVFRSQDNVPLQTYYM